MKYRPHVYQNRASQHIIDHPYAGVFLDMGLGKTVITLTAIDKLLFDYFDVAKVLVIAPLRVAQNTWGAEISKWEHLNHLKPAYILGTQRQRKQALREKADIFITNRENVPWLVGQYAAAWPFDMVVIDELSSFKSPQAQRFKALRQVRPLIKRVVGLTGTPAPNGLIDLWSQMYLLDRGERLYKTVGQYRETYFSAGQRNGAIVFNYTLKKGAEDRIHQKISDICISMQAEDYLKMPERVERTVDIYMSDDLKAKYEAFERDRVLELMTGDLCAVNAAALSTKLLQFANGAVYDESGAYHEMHKLKLEALADILEAANGQPVLVFYTYKHDLARIQKEFKSFKPRKLDTEQDIKDWNNGEISLMLAHPASAGHGLNLQEGGHILVWFGHTWSLELYQQGNARVFRQGQKKTVFIHHLAVKGTMDEDVLKALDGKADSQKALLDAVKVRIEKYAAQDFTPERLKSGKNKSA